VIPSVKACGGRRKTSTLCHDRAFLWTRAIKHDKLRRTYERQYTKCQDGCSQGTKPIFIIVRRHFSPNHQLVPPILEQNIPQSQLYLVLFVQHKLSAICLACPRSRCRLCQFRLKRTSRITSTWRTVAALYTRPQDSSRKRYRTFFQPSWLESEMDRLCQSMDDSVDSCIGSHCPRRRWLRLSSRIDDTIGTAQSATGTRSCRSI